MLLLIERFRRQIVSLVNRIFGTFRIFREQSRKKLIFSPKKTNTLIFILTPFDYLNLPPPDKYKNDVLTSRRNKNR